LRAPSAFEMAVKRTLFQKHRRMIYDLGIQVNTLFIFIFVTFRLKRFLKENTITLKCGLLANLQRGEGCLMSPATQKRRLLGVSSPLGADTLLLQRFAGSEGLGRLFSFDLELLSDRRHDIDLDKVVGQPMTVRVQLPAGGERYFNGVVSSFVQTAVGRAASDEVYSSYRATLVPWLWLLTRTANCRIFQEMTVPDIIKKIFSEYGFSGFVEDKLTATYPTWEYCVQYRETAFNFVSRLMEQEGIYYYFKHENGKHLLVLCDSPGAHQPFPGYASIPFRPTREKATPAGHITDWAIGKTLQPGKYTHTDYNFKKPRTPMLEDPFSWPFSAIRRPHQHAELEIFDYPGEFRLAPEGDQYAKTRIEELQAQYEVGSGSGTSCGIAPGCTFAMKNSLRADQNRAYLVVAASYTASAAEYATGNPGGDDTFACSFSAIPADTSYRPPRNTPKPTIQGAQTAVVVGPPGEEIYTDEYGRVKVQFHWDREHAYGPDSSCWIRVAQSWAGKKWGILFTPRIDHEVVVEFLEGDPDQPIITGRVYNADHIPPYALPDNKTISTMKSYSSKGGDGFNELRFEDKKGKEQIFIHAQRNLDIRVRNNMYETNYGNREVRVGWEKDGQSGGHLNTLVRLDVNTHIKGGQYEQVEKDRNQTVEGAVVESYKKDQTTQVTGTRTLNAKEVVVEASDAISEKTGKLALEGSQEVGIKGGSVNVESSQGISLKCGGNFVTIDASGVCINGSMVKINSGGAAKPAAAAKSAQLPTIEQPVEARLADDGKTGLATGLKKPPTPARQRTKVALTPIKAPPYELSSSGFVGGSGGGGVGGGGGGGGSWGGGGAGTKPQVVNCIDIVYVLKDEETDGVRVSNESLVIEIAPASVFGGDTVSLQADKKCKCAGAQVTVGNVKATLGSPVKVNAWLLPELPWPRMLFSVPDATPKRMPVDVLCGQDGTTMRRGEIRVWPSNVVSVKVELHELAKKWPSVDKFIGSLASLLSKVTRRVIDPYKDTLVLETVAGKLSVKAPQISLEYEGQWKEYGAKKKESWPCYYYWKASLNVCLGAEFKVDALVAASVITGVGAPVVEVVNKVRAFLKMEDPLVYLTLDFEVNGAGTVGFEETRFGTLEIKGTGSLALGASLEVKELVEANLEASTSVYSSVTADKHAEDRFKVVFELFKWEGVQGKISFKVHIGKLFSFGFEESAQLIDGTDALINCTLPNEEKSAGEDGGGAW
jgi:type VI secretion system secreted protein VgrG